LRVPPRIEAVKKASAPSQQRGRGLVTSVHPEKVPCGLDSACEAETASFSRHFLPDTAPVPLAGWAQPLAAGGYQTRRLATCRDGCAQIGSGSQTPGQSAMVTRKTYSVVVIPSITFPIPPMRRDFIPPLIAAALSSAVEAPCSTKSRRLSVKRITSYSATRPL
jgi:hypothetical protein